MLCTFGDVFKAIKAVGYCIVFYYYHCTLLKTGKMVLWKFKLTHPQYNLNILKNNFHSELTTFKCKIGSFKAIDTNRDYNRDKKGKIKE